MIVGKSSTADLMFRGINAIFLALLSISFVFPFYIVLVNSFTSESTLTSQAVNLWPHPFSLEAYRVVFATRGTIFHAFAVSIGATAIGTVQGVVTIALFGYAMAKESFPFKRTIMAAVVFTMIFSGGLIPTYLTFKALHLTNSFYVLTVFNAFNAANMIFIRNYFMSIPSSLPESARLDGAGEFQIFRNIMLPLSKPMLACMALFTAVAVYNDWTTPLYYNNHDTWVTVQLLLKRILVRIENLSTRYLAIQTKSNLPEEGIKAATVVVVAAPILLIYPFLQRYFITGSWLGSIKE